MKTLSAAIATALGAPVKRPSVLVEIGYSPVVRYSSRATLTWNSLVWTAAPIGVDGLQVSALKVGGNLILGNQDGVAGAMALAQGIKDRYIRIYGYDGAATATADVVWLCDAVGSGVTINAKDVRIQLRHRSDYRTSPRTLVSSAAGFTQLLPSGSVIRINGVDYKLQRRTT